MGLVYNRQSQTHVRRALRKAATAGERALWQELKGSRLGLKFRRQYGVENYVVDFYCPSLRLAIELDGASHLGTSARQYDRLRQESIERLGIRVVRFSEHDAIHETEGVVDLIRVAISSLLA